MNTFLNEPCCLCSDDLIAPHVFLVPYKTPPSTISFQPVHGAEMRLGH